ncbi:MAG: HAD family phosphatase [Myxococcales bacterium]|nr:MAG: HAD family phosphatase [Myxococcales bacterium]
MDGTLVDTEPYWIDTEFELAAEYADIGATWSHEHALHLVGNDLLESGRYIQHVMKLPLTPAEIVERLLDGVVARMEEAVPWRPGARELLADLNENGVPCALVTMSYRRFVEPMLAHLPDGTFTAVITGDEVSHGKPHPEPYLAAARALGVHPGSCVALEDSNTGATSAQAAGCITVVVPNHVPVPEVGGRHRFESLVGISAADLAGLRTIQR